MDRLFKFTYRPQNSWIDPESNGSTHKFMHRPQNSHIEPKSNGSALKLMHAPLIPRLALIFMDRHGSIHECGITTKK